MIELTNVNSGYGETQILNRLSATFRDNNVNCIIGPNGSGKSTALKTINGLLSVWEGTIEHNGIEIQEKTPREIVQEGIITVPQGGEVFPDMTVKENLRMGAYLTNDKEVLQDRYEYVYKVFPKLEQREEQRTRLMSGGEQAMVAIGRALMADPAYLLLDEPSAGLSPNLVEQIFGHLRRVKEEGVNMIIIEQNISEVLEISGYVFLMDQGEIRFEGSPDELRKDHDIVKMYLGSHGV